MVNDIADALYWLEDVDSPLVLRCTYNVIVKNLLQICIVDEDHIHPLQVHCDLAKFAIYVLFQTYLDQCDAVTSASVIGYIQSHFGHQISSMKFKNILIDLLIEQNNILR
jgi:hypothetical protein